jgi:hypothetical protein
VVVVSTVSVAETVKTLEDAGEKAWKIGSLVPRQGEGCILRNMEVWNQ